jgi:hypothetical protein
MRARFGTGAGVSVVRSKTLASDEEQVPRLRVLLLDEGSSRR